MALTIQSPGVQIIETDLSQQIAVNGGTNVFLAGFAPQGPTDELLQITSISEFETIFGTPTTAAERYFYYNSQAILNSSGNLLATRLPYGSGGGTGFSTNTFSGVLFPVASSSGQFSIGAPTHITINETDYLALLQNNFTWSTIGSGGNTFTTVTTSTVTSAATVLNTASAAFIQNLSALDPTPLTYSITYTGGNTITITYDQLVTLSATSVGQTASFTGAGGRLNAGIVVLNTSQTTVDEFNQGYYVGLTDNTTWGPNTPFNAIQNIFSLSATDTFTPVPLTNLSFTLTGAAGSFGNSVSQVIESLPSYTFGNPYYNDSLILTVFKVRNSTYQPNLLTYSLVESYIGSLNSNKKTSVGGSTTSSFLRDIVNNNSNNIKVLINPNISTNTNWVSPSSTNPAFNVVNNNALGLYSNSVYAPTFNAPATTTIGALDQKLTRAFNLINTPETSTVDIVVDGGLSTIFANTSGGGNVTFRDSIYSDVATLSSYSTSNTLQYWSTIFNTFNNFVQNTRKDCVFIADPLRQIFVNGTDTKTLDIPGANFTSNIFVPLQQSLANIDTNYSAIYGNWIKIFDSYTSNFAWVPASGYVAGIFANSDTATQPWIAPAGLNRGVIRNIVDIGFNPNQKQRDYLYQIGVNPIVNFSGEGYVVYGQKTLQSKPSSFDRINVRRLFITLERAVQNAVKYFVFEPNTDFTRTRLINTITPVFELAKNTQGLYDYLIVCDERNNTPDVIDNNQLNVDVYIKPVRAAEFILVNFIATRTGQNFSELI